MFIHILYVSLVRGKHDANLHYNRNRREWETRRETEIKVPLYTFRYINECNEMFGGLCAIVTATTSLVLTLCLFLLVSDSWIGGYVLVIPFVGQLFINSLIGTIATIQVLRT